MTAVFAAVFVLSILPILGTLNDIPTDSLLIVWRAVLLGFAIGGVVD